MVQNTNSVNNSLSRYVQGGITDVFTNRLGWWEPTLFTSQSDDIQIFALPSKYNTRPDLLAYDTYGKATLAWIVLQYNLIVDIEEQFVTGVALTLPSVARVTQSMLQNKTGGNVVSS